MGPSRSEPPVGFPTWTMTRGRHSVRYGRPTSSGSLPWHFSSALSGGADCCDLFVFDHANYR
jgi:hypothetical protein